VLDVNALATELAPSVVALLLALAWDRTLGEPPARAHPVVWMGRAIDVALRFAPRAHPAAEFAYGTLVAIALPVGCAAAGLAALAATARWPLVRLALEVFLLKSTFALRALGEAAEGVRAPLVAGDLAAARVGLRSLCSRDPGALDAPLLAAATVESVAENASDSFVAPLLCHAVLGLPGALFFRAVNTLDARIGYRGRFEWLGKPAARLDDLLGLVPARCTALLLLVAGAWQGRDVQRGRMVRARDAATTASPNAGQPMAVMAGLLGVALEKPGAYRLGDAIHAVTARTIDDAWRITHGAATMAAVLAVLIAGLRDALGV
jgi:adenosylcobinamide-phosphate synthase